MELRLTKSGVCVEGFAAAGVKEGKYGVALIASDRVCDCAGVFTTNNVKAAPVLVTRKMIKNGIQAVVANSGNANACVPEGAVDANHMRGITAKALGVSKNNVGVASTGIIGRRMNMPAVEKLIKKASENMSSSPDASIRAAKAIMTTDTRLKQVSVKYGGVEVGGMAKGAGMIAPNMATMLCFITTNADLEISVLQKALKRSVDDSFNMMVVDGDMSTNDMVLLLSSRRVKCGMKVFQRLLDYVTAGLARKIVEDGEGATKFIEVNVVGAKTKKDARTGAKAIASSLMVKTMVYGENPNWGRIMQSLGQVVAFKFNKTDIILSSGSMKAFAVRRGIGGNLDKLRSILENKNIKITVNLHSGGENATSWGCDITPEYVNLNAGYS